MRPQPGWRFFKCEDCECHFKIPCRDCTSPSLDVCPCCEELVHPYEGVPDTRWSLDPTTGGIKGVQEEVVIIAQGMKQAVRKVIEEFGSALSNVEEWMIEDMAKEIVKLRKQLASVTQASQ